MGLKEFSFLYFMARIFPNGNVQINQKGIDYYNNVINELIRNGIVPIVTLFHFELPLGLIDQYKGLVSRKCIEVFINYAHACFESSDNRIPYWLTINKQKVIANIPFLNGLTDIMNLCRQIII